jgi:hypothetical protein
MRASGAQDKATPFQAQALFVLFVFFVVELARNAWALRFGFTWGTGCGDAPRPSRLDGPAEPFHSSANGA